MKRVPSKDQQRWREVVSRLMSFQEVSQVALAESAGIRRPNLANWLGEKNGLSEEKLTLVCSALHVPDGSLQQDWLHDWRVRSWSDVRAVLEAVTTETERRCFRVFHSAGEVSCPFVLLLCSCELPAFENDPLGPQLDRFHAVLLTHIARIPLRKARELGFEEAQLSKQRVQVEASELRGMRRKDFFSNGAFGALIKETVDSPVDKESAFDEFFQHGSLDERHEFTLRSLFIALGRKEFDRLVGFWERHQGKLTEWLRDARSNQFAEEEVVEWLGLLSREPRLARELLKMNRQSLSDGRV